MSIGTKIKEARAKKNISQIQLAEILDTSQSLVAAYENGSRTPKIETLSRIAAALDVSFQSLLPEEMTENNIVLSSYEDKAIFAAVQDLNREGKKKVREYAEDISKNPRYHSGK